MVVVIIVIVAVMQDFVDAEAGKAKARRHA
jgi:hypothetical protein